MTKRSLAAWAIGLVVVMAAAVFGILELVLPAVPVAPVTRGPVVKAVYATGRVEPVRWSKVTPLHRGRVVDLCFCEGKTVEKDQVLAKLDDRERRADVVALEARLQYLADEVERKRTLLERRVISEQAFDNAVAERDQMLGVISAARQRLENMVLRSPMEGVVLRRDGELGEVVAPGDVLFWVGEPKPLWITAEVDEEDIPLVRLGHKTLIKADAFPNRVLEGDVAKVTPMGDPVNKNYRVRIAIPDDSPLLIGMTTDINILVDQREEALLVPSDAVRENRLYVVEQGRARVVTVTMGVQGDELVEISDGVAADAWVISPWPEGLRDGSLVRQRQRGF